ncbi:RTA1 domain protein [Penicillium cosmopolitanum]|uniref:RTA1 domain protein n=1 Tax=Penicillium cosmopolitanum TaxID=1131564 RepID=A0A9W9SG02_9EURO|nr:RTA1 domain protein [Penicillium cosmopolitanum]KAJ5376534.1 RTA1 domain protein [Penicillium cosmopolitanum]
MANFSAAAISPPLVIGAFLEVFGYGIRCASLKQPDSIPLYAVSATLIVIAPVFVCASLYLLMDRLIWTGNDEKSSERSTKFLFINIRRRWLPRIFVTLDIISCLTQASGSGIAASGDWEGSAKDTGNGVLIGGLVLQVVTFTAFLIIVGSFHLKSKNDGNTIDQGVGNLLKGIYISGIFILVRCIYRVIEFALGVDAYLFIHEWPLYVLEAVPMIIAISVLGWYHPGRFLYRPGTPHAQRSSQSANF